MSNWYQTKTRAVLETFGVQASDGLSAQEAAARLQTYGGNRIQTVKPVNPFKIFFDQFKDILVIILLGSATVSLLVSMLGSGEGNAAEEAKEAILIYAIVLAIALVGFFNEFKAEKTIEALRGLVGHDARVRRDGQTIQISADQIVPGDIVLLDEGQKIPADLRLLEVKQLQVNEASLTGESEAVDKSTKVLAAAAALGDQLNMAFTGTFVTSGTAVGVAVATGSQTELGKIAKLMQDIPPEVTPMQRKLNDLGRKLGMFVMVLCVAVFLVVFFLVDEAIDKTMAQRLIFAFTAAVALAVAAVPEGLAFVVRIALALGARRMANRKALVRKLSAVEALGSTDTICTDKTGTLTKGEMTVRELWQDGHSVAVSGTGYVTSGVLTEGDRTVSSLGSLERLLLGGALCNNAHLKTGTIIGDPTEAALLVVAAKPGIAYETLRHEWPRVDEIAFSSDRKLMSTVHQAPEGDYFVATKGALEQVLRHATQYLTHDGKTKPLTASVEAVILKQHDKMASHALRVLAVAYKRSAAQPKGEHAIESELVFAGLQGIMDPPREEVVQVIRQVQTDAGLRVVMITGDHIETAKAIAHEIGLQGEAITGEQLEALSQADFEKRAETIAVYARVNPEHKIRIVQTLQKLGHQVAMTGDGVNDAPAIKAADIGIAMGITGTDAAKEAADLILLDDQFVTIIHAIEEGRGIFDNVRKFVNFLISCNIAEVLVVLTGILLFHNLLLTAAQILFINIVTDGLPAVALGSDPAQRNALKAKPHHFQQAILTKRVWVEIVAFGLLMTLVLIWHYTYLRHSASGQTLSTAIFAGMVVYEMVRLVDIRTDYHIRWFQNPWLSVSVAISFMILLAVLYIKPVAHYFGVGVLPGREWLVILVGSIAIFACMKLLNPIFAIVGPENTSQNHKA